MKQLLAAAAVVAVGLATPAAASAATFSVSPARDCYGSGHPVELSGSGFTPSNEVSITKNGRPVDPAQPTVPTDVTGAFGNIGLRFGQESGRETHTYAATDIADPSLTASMQVTLSAVNVGLRPQSGAPGRRLRIRANGFTTGETLWVHVVRGRFKRHIKLGRLRGDCHNLTTRRRLLPRDARVGIYTVQFDAFRKYVKASPSTRQNSVSYTVNVRRVFRPAAAGSGWSRIF